jgi:hypothetical protein
VANLENVKFVHTDTAGEPFYPLAVPEPQDTSEKEIKATTYDANDPRSGRVRTSEQRHPKKGRSEQQ